MRLSVTISALVFIVAYVSKVDAVKCTEKYECAKTDVLTGTCENSICKCIDGYTATEYGCAETQVKPIVRTESNSAEAFEGVEVILTCVGGRGTYTYAWYKDGADTPLEIITRQIRFTMSGKAEAYQCALTVDGTLVSEKSDSVTIAVLNADSTTSQAQPVVTLSSPSVAAGKTFDVRCAGAPFGLTNDEINLADNDDTPLTNPITQLASTDGKSIICKFEREGYTFKKEGKTNYPTVIDSIQSVTIRSVPHISSNAVFVEDDKVELNCDTVPLPAYLPAGDVTYKWSEESGPTTSQWTLPSKKGTFTNVTCTATRGKFSKTSEKFFNITFDSASHLAAPTVTALPAAPYKTGQVVLTCHTGAADVEIEWTKDTMPLLGHTGKTLFYNDLTDNAPLSVTCTIKKSFVEQTSPLLTVNVIEKPLKPAITGAHEMGKEGDLNLTCASDSAGQGMIYIWKKDDKVVDKANSLIFSIMSAKDKDTGDYVCEQKYGELDAQTSEKYRVDIVAAGVKCENDEQCDETDKSLTGVCNVKDKRCQCAKHYKPKGNFCVDGAGQMVASLVLVLMAALVSRLL